MKTDNLIPAAPLDRRELAPGVQLCFTRLDAPLCPPPLDWPRLLVFDFCRSGRRAIPDGAQYAIVTEGHAAVSFAVPGADFYLPGSQYEALQLFIDPDAVQADSFLTLMGLEIGGIADYFCRGGVHCCPMSDVAFDETICRNIAVDIRYVLFVIDRIGGAGYLFGEMDFGKRK